MIEFVETIIFTCFIIFNIELSYKLRKSSREIKILQEEVVKIKNEIESEKSIGIFMSPNRIKKERL